MLPIFADIVNYDLAQKISYHGTFVNAFWYSCELYSQNNSQMFEIITYLYCPKIYQVASNELLEEFSRNISRIANCCCYFRLHPFQN